jgi:hypothetical protein
MQNSNSIEFQKREIDLNSELFRHWLETHRHGSLHVHELSALTHSRVGRVLYSTVCLTEASASFCGAYTEPARACSSHQPAHIAKSSSSVVSESESVSHFTACCTYPAPWSFARMCNVQWQCSWGFPTVWIFLARKYLMYIYNIFCIYILYLYVKSVEFN